MNNVTTHTDDGFAARVSAIANRIAFGAEVDPNSNPFEVIAARMLLADESKQIDSDSK